MPSTPCSRFPLPFSRRINHKKRVSKLLCIIMTINMVLLSAPNLAEALPDIAYPLVELSKNLGNLFTKKNARPAILATAPVQESLADRISRVSSIRITPRKLVGYLGETQTFSAVGLDYSGNVVHGVRFTWDTSNDNKIQIDESGRATFLQPGLTRIICRAGLTEATAAVLVRPNHRPVQSDQQWRQDQDSLQDSTVGLIDTERLLASTSRSLPGGFYPQGGGSGNDLGGSAPLNAVGTPPNTLQEQTLLGPVMPQNNFNVGIPVASLGGRGLAANLMLYYNSNVWGARFDTFLGTVYVFDPVSSWPSPGFTLGFGRIAYYDFQYDQQTATYSYRLMLIDPNGTRHDLGRAITNQTSTCQSSDGTHITFVGSALGGGTLYYQDGTKVTYSFVNNRLLPTRITETNGNYIQIAYKLIVNGFSAQAIDYVTDTLGRVIQFTYSGTSLISINPPSGYTTAFGYSTVTLDTTPTYGDPPVTENAPASFQGISSVIAPPLPQYQFTYARYGMIYRTDFQGGGSVTYNFPTEDSFFWQGLLFTQRTESPGGVYAYPAQGYVQRPDGTQLYLTGNSSMEVKNSSNQTVAKTEYTYTNDPGGQPQVQSITSYDETNKATKVDFDYDLYGNVINKREYGYKINGQWQVRRRTASTYVNATYPQYIDAYMRSLLMKVEIFDAHENTSDTDDTLIKKVEYTYDGAGLETYPGSPLPPGYLSSYDNVSARGNVTSTKVWTDLGTNTSTTHNTYYDKYGNVVKAQVSCCQEKNYTLTENTYWSKPEIVKSGNPSGTYLTSSAVYNFNSGTVASETNSANQTTSYSYDTTARPTGVTTSTGASQTISYGAWGPTSSTTTYTEGGVPRTITSSATYNGFGQVLTEVDGNGAQVNTSYNNMGRLEIHSRKGQRQGQ